MTLSAVTSILDNPPVSLHSGIMMLTNISGRTPQDAPAPFTPLEILESCHARIRHFLRLSRTLAEAVDAPQSEIVEAAAALVYYFSQALPLHEADENETLYPRLHLASLPGSPLREAAKAMVEQHQAIDEMVAELLSLCASIHRQPERLPSLARLLRQVADSLDQAFASHLQMEETVIFPALQQFTPSQLEKISREMQQRRRPPGHAIHLVR
jgi:iron-sulfur cluster repair protein YtfE (RIC family)